MPGESLLVIADAGIADLHDVSTLDAQLVTPGDPRSGLGAGSVLRGRGVLVANINDVSGARDLGYQP